MSESLRKYHAKRDFAQTTEPSGESEARRKGDEPIFVIQRHDASTLHYDFRLEVDGVLVSWAVPKGLPQKTGVRRLAVRTEDHPLAYANFEGRIPKGQYGAGQVKIWDKGAYRNLRAEKDERASMADTIAEGKIEVYLEGEQVKGPYALIRTDSEEGNWIILRMKAGDAGEQ